MEIIGGIVIFYIIVFVLTMIWSARQKKNKYDT